jgi:hypothetical protein
MSSDSDSSDDNKSTRLEKLTIFNWVQWKSRFTLYLKSHNLDILFDEKWREDEKNQEQ